MRCETGSAPCLSAKMKASNSGPERTSPGLKLAVYTWNYWGKGVTETSGLSPLDVWLKLEGESSPLSFFSFSCAVCSVYGDITLQQFPFSSPATVPYVFYLIPEPSTDIFLMVCMICYRK